MFHPTLTIHPAFVVGAVEHAHGPDDLSQVALVHGYHGIQIVIIIEFCLLNRASVCWQDQHQLPNLQTAHVREEGFQLVAKGPDRVQHPQEDCSLQKIERACGCSYELQSSPYKAFKP